MKPLVHPMLGQEMIQIADGKYVAVCPDHRQPITDCSCETKFIRIYRESLWRRFLYGLKRGLKWPAK